MRVLLAVALFAVLAFADISLTGRFTTGTPSFNYPDTSVACAPSTSTYFFKVFNTTFATAGVRTIQILGSSSIPVYIYRGSFDGAAPCTNIQVIDSSSSTVYRYENSNNDNTQTLQTSFGFQFEADTYFFVLTSTSVGSTSSSAFGVNVIEPVHSQAVAQYIPGAAQANVWRQPATTSSSTVSYNGNATYASYTWTATETGNFDIGAFVVNATASASLYASLAIFSGAPSAADIYAAAAPASGSIFPIYPYDNGDDEGVWVFFVPLVAGQQYTVVASNENSDDDGVNIGFFVVHTAANRLTAGSTVTGVFSEPAAYSASSTCSSRGSSYVGLPYVVRSFNVLGNIVVAKSSDQYSYNRYINSQLQISGLDWYTYLYQGNNSVFLAQCGCPTCRYVSSTDDGTIYNTAAAASVHTLIVSTYSGSPTITATSGIVTFYFNGPTIGEAALVPTSAPTPTTSTPTTSTPTTSTPTTSTPTTSTPTTSTPTTSSPSAAPTCAPYTATVTITFASAPDACRNASVVAFLAGTNSVSGTTATCVNTTTTAGTITIQQAGATACSANQNDINTLIAYFQSFGFTGVTVTTSGFPTAAPPAPASTSTTSGAANVVASVFVVAVALFGLVL